MDEPHLDGVADQPRHAMNAEALDELGAVRLDGLQRHLEAAGDFLVGMPLGDELQHLALAWCEYLEWPVGSRAGALRIRRDDTLGERRAEPCIATRHRVQRQLQLAAVGILEQVARGTGDQRAPHRFIVAVHRDDDDARSRVFLCHAGGQLEAVESRHGDIQQRDVGFALTDEPQRFAAVACFRHHRDAWQLTQEREHTRAHQRMIVREQESQRTHVSLPAVSGKRARTVVPRPGAESISRSPPASATRSCMLSRPWLPPFTARWRAAGTSKPRPSSRTMSCSVPLAALSSTSTACACAWRMTLVSASCATRKQVVSTAAGGRCTSGARARRLASPARLASRSTYQRNDASSPSSSSSGGGRACASPRIRAISPRTDAMLSASPRPWACRLSLSAVSTCPKSSWSSRATARRSASCASISRRESASSCRVRRPSSSSARLRSVISALVPYTRSGRPDSSRTTVARPKIQCRLPSGRTTRYSMSPDPVPASSCPRRSITHARSSGWMTST